MAMNGDGGGLDQRGFRPSAAIGGAWRVFRDRFGYFFTIALLTGLLGAAAQWILALGLGAPALSPFGTPDPTAIEGVGPSFFVALAGVVVLSFVVFAAMFTMIGYGVVSASFGRRVSLAETVAQSLGRVWRALLVFILQTLAIFAATFAAALVVALVAAPFFSGQGAQNVALFQLPLIILLVAAVPTIAIYLRLFAAAPAAVVEELGPMQSLSRSVSLTQGSRWRILGMLLALFAVLIVISLIFTAGSAALFLSQGGAEGIEQQLQIGGPVFIGLQLISMAFSAAMNAFFIVLSFVVYQQLVAIKDGGVDPRHAVDVFQ